MSYDRHVYYINVTQLAEVGANDDCLGNNHREALQANPGKIVWFNLIRDPVQKFVSRFFYSRMKKTKTKYKTMVERGKEVATTQNE